MHSKEYRNHDATGLAELVRSGDVTADELMDAALSEIEKHNGDINAVVHRLDDRARAAVAGGLPQGPFTGVPYLFKDQLDIEGTPMTLGSALLDGFSCTHTHPLAARMESSGLVALGRINMSELGMVPTTEPVRFGPTRNPWNREHSVGGSSGGSAAAVAAGLVPIAHAADGGGSIRIPAAACGLVGLKPSRGRNPTAPYDDPDGFVVHHCVSRTVRDSATFLDATCGSRDGRWRLPDPEQPYASVVQSDPSPLRIGFTARGIWGEEIHPAARRAVESTAALLEDLGHTVEEVEAPLDADAFAGAFRTLWAAATGVFFKLARKGLAETDRPAWMLALLRNPSIFRVATGLPLAGGRPMVEEFTRRLERMDQRASPSDLWLAGCVMDETAARFANWFETRDLMLSTVLTSPPLRLGTLDLGGSDDDVASRLFGYVAFTPVANGTGIPAITVPAGLSEDEGLPMGAHFMAPLGREDRLLALAGQIERARPWQMPQL